jgi:hypothetical protein
LNSFLVDENLVKLKQILLIILPDAVELDTDEKRKFAGEKLYDMFQDEIDNIISVIMSRKSINVNQERLKKRLVIVFVTNFLIMVFLLKDLSYSIFYKCWYINCFI